MMAPSSNETIDAGSLQSCLLWLKNPAGHSCLGSVVLSSDSRLDGSWVQPTGQAKKDPQRLRRDWKENDWARCCCDKGCRKGLPPDQKWTKRDTGVVLLENEGLLAMISRLGCAKQQHVVANSVRLC